MKATTKKLEDRWETGILWRDKNYLIAESKDAALSKTPWDRKESWQKHRLRPALCFAISRIPWQRLLPAFQLRKEKRNITCHISLLIIQIRSPDLFYDEATKSNGKSFNNFFLTGPGLLRPLPEVILCFWKHKIAVIGDMEAMFHQVKLRKEEQGMQTLLYRGMNPTSPPTKYQMSVLFFGSVCSPASAIYAKDRNAE